MAKQLRLTDREQTVVCAALAFYAAHKRDAVKLAFERNDGATSYDWDTAKRLLEENDEAIALFDRIDR